MLSRIFSRAPLPVENCLPVQDTPACNELSAQEDSTGNLSESSTRVSLPIQGDFEKIHPDTSDPRPSEDTEEDGESLLDWWRGVEGWEEWNKSINIHEDMEDVVVEQAADRVYMAAQLFVRLLEQHSDSLHCRVRELLSVADAADGFHKRTVAASVGGGVASVAGGMVTISGLVLAPFTFGTSLVVTAVGIGVATLGGLTSASANITDTVHSSMDRKKVEKMIQDYQEEMKDIKECLEFVQEGVDVLRQWDFEEYMESLSRQALNQNLKHVMKEGGRAGKALFINTEKLVNTVQVLSVAGGAARAAQAVSIATGVMSALFLALDVFFLARDSHELHTGAKTKFAAKIREVCKELENGLQELKRIKEELQKTMNEEELQMEEEKVLLSDVDELALLEKQLDQLENEFDERALKKSLGEGQGRAEKDGQGRIESVIVGRKNNEVKPGQKSRRDGGVETGVEIGLEKKWGTENHGTGMMEEQRGTDRAEDVKRGKEDRLACASRPRAYAFYGSTDSGCMGGASLTGDTSS
ncbi:apolipoprotein L3 [Brienomyrus brachyistius]|uniref:apolipoprotein L3 n=1 Tax=Brienomyrus brachyistius TaxID=42636 RepID=UPI0020B31B43|nr:apolipoprotein L3 [Brienomyrus brachyistius]